MNFTDFNFIILTLIFCSTIFGQVAKQKVNENKFKGVTLTYLSQRCIPPDKVPYIGTDFIDFSDLKVRFRLENNNEDEVYYLANTVDNSISPVGFVLHRRSETKEWNSTYTPEYNSESAFTGNGYHWLSLPSNSAVEFERTDVSFRKGEHATTVFFNTEAQYKNRVEVISNKFSTVNCPKSKK